MIETPRLPGLRLALGNKLSGKLNLIIDKRIAFAMGYAFNVGPSFFKAHCEKHQSFLLGNKSLSWELLFLNHK